MSAPETVELTPAQAADLVRDEADRAADALQAGDADAALDGYVRALGLALQLGPQPTEQTLQAALAGCRQLARRGDAQSLSTLGPALIDLIRQMEEAGALPPTSVMRAWAAVVADVGTVVGQVGLALALGPQHRAGMVENARTRAALLDEATGGILALAAWLNGLSL